MKNEFKLVEKRNHLAVHALFSSRASAEKHLREVIPDYCARGLFMDKSLTPESFEVVGDQPSAAGEAAHTPTPWIVQGAEIRATGREFPTIICDPFSGQWENENGTRRRLLPIDEREANAAFIVRACNEYAANKDLLASYEARDDRNVAALNKSDEENERLKAKCAGLVEALAYCRNRAKGLQAELLEPGGRAPISISELSDIENKARLALAAAKL